MYYNRLMSGEGGCAYEKKKTSHHAGYQHLWVNHENACTHSGKNGHTASY